MITARLTGRQPLSWQKELAQAVTDPAQLLAALSLDTALLAAAQAAAAGFRMRVPWSYVRRMRRGDPRDPLLRQVLPLGDELVDAPGYSADPLGERAANRVPGLLHKYHGRALLITTGACAVHCRYCFRREFPYEAQVTDGRWSEALRAIAADRRVEELILSGGDPLSLSNERLAALTGQLTGIAHLARLRIHTRAPIVLPSRVDGGLAHWLAQLPWPVVVVVHANHAQEIDAEVAAAFARLRAAGVTLLNQSVLLAGVNDDADALANLSTTLFAAGALPYYLHLLDRVRGASHFDVTEARGRELMRAISARLPGYLVPKLVREEAGAPGKTLISFDETSVLRDGRPSR
ncbi:MAG TPA: EF-P beta-lysylation protein EpmB [Steroidobacteraceae bacterium]|nr:EF-P beta-lysylation protein EpmB [Steroidobacteraceae bacterium]